MIRTAPFAALTAAFVVALTGCATASEPESALAVESTAEAQSPSPDPTPESTPEPTSEPTPEVTPTPSEVAAAPASQCDQIAGEQTVGIGSVPEESLGGLPIVLLQDIGARPGAEGEVTLDENGDPASYVVASGDTQDAIAERFCATPSYVDLMNSIRRQNVHVDPPEGCWPKCGDEYGWKMDLYAGDTLNLNPYTIASVGDQNGQVYANEPDIMMPPQR